MVEPLDYMRMDQQSDQIVEALIFDITCLAGIRKEWDQIDEELQKAIKKDWKLMIMNIFHNFKYSVGEPLEQFVPLEQEEINMLSDILDDYEESSRKKVHPLAKKLQEKFLALWQTETDRNIGLA